MLQSVSLPRSELGRALLQQDQALPPGCCISTPLVDQAPEPIAARPPALATGNVHRIEFADEITEDGCAVAGHWRH